MKGMHIGALSSANVDIVADCLFGECGEECRERDEVLTSWSLSTVRSRRGRSRSEGLELKVWGDARGGRRRFPIM